MGQFLGCALLGVLAVGAGRLAWGLCAELVEARNVIHTVFAVAVPLWLLYLTDKYIEIGSPFGFVVGLVVGGVVLLLVTTSRDPHRVD